MSTGPLARPFARSLTLLTRSLAPDCSLCSRPPLRSLVRSLSHFTHCLARGTVNDWMAILPVFFSIFDHSEFLARQPLLSDFLPFPPIKPPFSPVFPLSFLTSFLFSTLSTSTEGEPRLHLGPEQPYFSVLIIHFSTSSGVNERASNQMSAAEYASKQTNERSGVQECI